jgi:glycosyltransferase involved in cell wall biosynthesis
MNVIYLGCNGFPNGFAEVQKQKMIGKALVCSGAKVTIVNTWGVFGKRSHGKMKYRGEIDGLRYIYTSFIPYKPDNFLIRNTAKVIGKIAEVIAVFCLRKRKQRNIAVLSTQNIYSLIYYYYVLKIIGYNVVLSYEEFVKILNVDKNKKGLHLKFDDIAHRYCDAFLPISKFLSAYQQNLNPGKPFYKIPALTDFKAIDEVYADGKRADNVLFCGASVYYENISFIIDAFDFVADKQVNLVLIIHGNALQNQRVLDCVEKSAKRARIKILSNLSTEKLFREYKEAKLLLIPLKPYERDIARFPHKISEYTAARTPIVTTGVGEINHYFKDNITAFVAANYDPEEFAAKIDHGLNNPLIAEEVAGNAYQLGMENFHFSSISRGLYDFLLK